MSLSRSDIAPGLTGTALTEALSKAHDGWIPIAEGLIYEKQLLMLFSDPGIGKSTIFTQIAVELAAGLPLFGVFPVVRPIPVLYVQAERSIFEFLRRIEILSKVYPIIAENIMVTDEFQKLNMLNNDHVTIMIETIKRDFPQAKVSIFDPIYCMVSGGLKNDEPASAFTHAMSLVQKAIGCTNLYGHHTVKEQYEKGVAVDKEDKSYGSRFLKAHITGSFEVSHSKEGKGAILTRKKDNYGLLPSSIKLDYCHETGLCTIPTDELPAAEKIRFYGLAMEMADKEFDMQDIMKATGLSREWITKVVLHSQISSNLILVSNRNNKHLYKYSSRKTSCDVK